MIPMHCGGCGRQVMVTVKQWQEEDTIPCPHCSDGGVDLVHARRHADNV